MGEMYIRNIFEHFCEIYDMPQVNILIFMKDAIFMAAILVLSYLTPYLTWFQLGPYLK